jgi:nuclease EXOG
MFNFFFQNPANRKLAKFIPDPGLPVEISASNDDFWDSGWSRGHMAPAGNNKHSQQAMNDTFYLSNIVAQVNIFFPINYC